MHPSSISSSDGYAYGFNGQMKVNEWAGSGNHTTALFWEYDVRTGRRGNLDPKGSIGMSHYCVFGNNPILNFDINGDIFVDAKNSPVYMSFNKDGSLKSISKNATTDIFRTANALNLTPTGRTMLKKMHSSDIKVHIKITPDSKIYKDAEGRTHYKSGETLQGNLDKKDDYGQFLKDGIYGIKEASIVIYEGTIKEQMKPGTEMQTEGLKLEQAVGSVAGHEGVHATDKTEIHKDIKATLSGKKRSDQEVKPEKIEQQIVDESKAANKKQ